MGMGMSMGLALGRARPIGLILPGAVLVADMATPNLLRWSEQFDNAVWAKLKCTVTPNATLAPDGTLTADKLVEDTSGGFTHQTSQTLSQLTAGGTVTIPFYLKAGGRTWAWINVYDGADHQVWFDLDNGVVGSASPGVTGAISPAGNGWYRCAATYTAAPRAGGIVAVVGPAPTNGGTVYTGDGASGIYVWGAMLNEGSTPLPYVKTTDLQTITDLSGNGNTLTLGNSAGIDNADPINSGSYLDHDAVDDRLVVPSSAQIADTLQHTLIIVGRSGDAGSLWYSEGDGSSTEWLYLERVVSSTNSIKARYRRTTATAYDVSITTPNNSALADTWMMVTLRRDGNRADISINDTVNRASSMALGAQALPSRPLRFTNAITGPSLPAVSGMDVAFMGVLHRYISDSEIIQLYSVVKFSLASRAGGGISLP